MRARIAFALCLFVPAFSLSSGTARADDCYPSVASGKVCLGEPCNVKKLGTTTMDGDQINIISCLYDNAVTPRVTKWKGMTKDASGSNHLYYQTFATLATYKSGCSYPSGGFSTSTADGAEDVIVWCISACNRWCLGSDPEISGKNYTGGTIVDWDQANDKGGCLCS